MIQAQTRNVLGKQATTAGYGTNPRASEQPSKPLSVVGFTSTNSVDFRKSKGVGDIFEAESAGIKNKVEDNDQCRFSENSDEEAVKA